MLTPEWPELTLPANSSIRLGLVPAAWMTAGCEMSRGMGTVYRETTGSGLATGVRSCSKQKPSVQDLTPMGVKPGLGHA